MTKTPAPMPPVPMTPATSTTPARRRGLALAAAALLAVAPLLTTAAEARPGGGGIGSRGSRTNSAPAATPTAPTAAPIQRSTTQPSAAVPGAAAAAATAAARPSFARSLMFGLAGGLLAGALFSGLGGMGQVLGFLMQALLIGGVVWLALRLFRRRAPSLSAAGPAPLARDAAGPGAGALGGGLAGGLAGLGAARAAPGAAPARADEVGILPADYAAFERLLADVQAGFSREDARGLRLLTTPEMAHHLSEEIERNQARGVVNRVEDPRLIQGDLAEAWSEGGDDYATVAMRYAHRDATYDKATGRIVDGDPAAVVEATELWTFRRERGHEWRLSAIQQTA